MTIAKSTMIQRFLHGNHTGKASREELRLLNGTLCVVGYGWAVYAADLGDRYVLFGDGYKTRGNNVGWAGYSGTTTAHLQEIKGAFEERGVDYVVVDFRLEDQDVLDSEFSFAEIIEEYQVEKRESTGYLYRQ